MAEDRWKDWLSSLVPRPFHVYSTPRFVTQGSVELGTKPNSQSHPLALCTRSKHAGTEPGAGRRGGGARIIR